MLAFARAAGPSPLALMAVGDWGGDSDAVPATAAERAAAAGMSRVATDLNANAVLLLGDNFYTHGVLTNESTRFHETFEAIYRTDMFDIPFYVIAGNHDHRGSVSAQMDYLGSARWRFPSLWYSLPFNFTSTSGALRTVEMLMIDTPTLAGISDDVCDGCELLGPPDESVAESQWDWIETRLNASTADFLWVAGHYPIYSAGKDGTTPLLVRRLLPMLRAAGAHYISGHDHMHEHLLSDGVHMVVTGPGKECCYPASKWHTVPAGALRFMVSGEKARGPGVGPRPRADMSSGFSSLEFDDAVQLTMYAEDGTALYAPAPIAPRASRRAA